MKQTYIRYIHTYIHTYEREREMFYLTTHSTHFIIYGYMASDIWLRTIVIVRKETRCRHIGYSYRLTASVLLYAPSHRQGNTYHCLCYTSRGALAGTRNSSMGYIHTCMHTHIYIHTYRKTCMRAYIHQYIHTYIHTHTYRHTLIHTYMHTCIHTHIHQYIHTHTM